MSVDYYIKKEEMKEMWQWQRYDGSIIFHNGQFETWRYRWKYIDILNSLKAAPPENEQN